MDNILDAEIDQDVTPIEPMEEHPEIDQDEKELTEIKDTIVDLQAIIEEIDSIGGVNKKIAVSIETIKPGLLSERNPVNSFTVDTSKTNLTTTVEDIISGIHETIKYLFSIIGKIISKIIQFIRKLFSRFKDSEDHNANVIAKAKVLANEIYELRTRIDPRDQTIFNDVFSNVSKEANDTIKSVQNDLMREVVTGNKLRASMLAIGGSFNRYLDEINSKYILLEKAVKSAKSLGSSEIIYILADVNKYIKTGNADGVLRGVISNSNGTMANDLSGLKTFVYHLEESRSSQPMNYQYIFDAVRMDKLTVNDNYILDFSYTEKNLVALLNKVDKFKDFDTSVISGKGVLSNIEEATRVMIEEIKALQDFLIVCNRVVQANTKLASFVYNSVNMHYKQLLINAWKSDSETTRGAASASYHKVK